MNITFYGELSIEYFRQVIRNVSGDIGVMQETTLILNAA